MEHRITPRLSLNLNVNNVFHTGNMESDVENEVLRLHTLNVNQPRIVQIGLRYQWGGVTGDERIRGGRGMFRGGPGGGAMAAAAAMATADPATAAVDSATAAGAGGSSTLGRPRPARASQRFQVLRQVRDLVGVRPSALRLL